MFICLCSLFWRFLFSFRKGERRGTWNNGFNQNHPVSWHNTWPEVGNIFASDYVWNCYVIGITEQYWLREMCPNTELFLVRIFLYSDWIWRFTRIQSEYRKIQTRTNAVFGHISRSDYTVEWDELGHLGELGRNLLFSGFCHFITVGWLSLTWLLQFWLEEGYSSLKTRKYSLGIKFSHFLRKIRIFRKSFFQRMSKSLYWPIKMGRGRYKLMVFLQMANKNIIQLKNFCGTMFWNFSKKPPKKQKKKQKKKHFLRHCCLAGWIGAAA